LPDTKTVRWNGTVHDPVLTLSLSPCAALGRRAKAGTVSYDSGTGGAVVLALAGTVVVPAVAAQAVKIGALGGEGKDMWKVVAAKAGRNDRARIKLDPA
jgi:hypothetical protein